MTICTEQTLAYLYLIEQPNWFDRPPLQYLCFRSQQFGTLSLDTDSHGLTSTSVNPLGSEQQYLLITTPQVTAEMALCRYA